MIAEAQIAGCVDFREILRFSLPQCKINVTFIALKINFFPILCIAEIQLFNMIFFDFSKSKSGRRFVRIWTLFLKFLEFDLEKSRSWSWTTKIEILILSLSLKNKNWDLDLELDLEKQKLRSWSWAWSWSWPLTPTGAMALWPAIGTQKLSLSCVYTRQTIFRG